MDECINNFLENFKQGNIEGHSDSSDFEETLQAPRISPKRGKHSLFDRTHTKAERPLNKVSVQQPMNSNLMNNDNIPERDHNLNPKRVRKKIHKIEFNTLNNRGDDGPEQHLLNNSINSQQKPRFSSVQKLPNYTRQISSTKDIIQDHLTNGKTLCADCERRRIKKLNRRRQSYVVQPVYAVDNIQSTSRRDSTFPFGHANDRAPLLQHARKQESHTSYELTSSESDIGNKNQRKHSTHRRNFIDRFQKEMRKEYLKYEKELLRNRIQQYPSKRYYTTPNDEFSNPYCQVINANAIREGDQSNIPSTSTGFWEYLFEKIRGKRQPGTYETPKPCHCKQEETVALITPLSQPQTQLNYEEKSLEENTFTKESEGFPECHSCMQQTDDIQTPGLPNIPLRKNHSQSEKKETEKVTCKCYKKKQRKHQMDEKKVEKGVQQYDDVTRPCQEPHEDVTKTVEEKYNGEILCIHNPPCILINGCLNLPPSERTPVQGNYWPVMQDKKSSFYHVCKKMKRNKNNCEQGCQYHPPSIEVQRAMQIKEEKIVQSICNHDPPCEVVYGCYKPKYDPKLENSCVHVPMCQRMPECMIVERNEKRKTEIEKDNTCEHKPKCTEVPLCSRKFVVLTAKGTVGTQVRPKSKLVCRHDPPCIMIPKCLARIISDGYLEAIPDCVHQPCCDLIPACCRKAAKETVKLGSVEDGLSLKLPRPPLAHKNRILRAMRRSTKTN